MSAPLKSGMERPFLNDPRLARIKEYMEKEKLSITALKEMIDNPNAPRLKGKKKKAAKGKKANASKDSGKKKRTARGKKVNASKNSGKSKISYAHLNKVLNGVMPLNLNLIEKIAMALKLNPSYFYETTIVNKQKVKKSADAQLMSVIVDGAEGIFRYVEGLNVDKLAEFFNNEPTRPLIATGHGGKFSQAVYAALLYSTNKGLGKAVTCYSCNSLSDATIKNSKILLCSRGMANIDIDYIANRCLDLNPDFTCAMRISTDAEAEKQYMKTVKKLKDKPYSIVFNMGIELPENFIGISSVFFYSAVLYKAFSGDSDFVSKLELNKDPLANYSYSSADGLMEVPTLDKINRFTVLYGSYGEPVAYNIESNIVESGIGSCMISDYKNYTHGRFMVEGNYIKSEEHPQTEAALICLVTPREALIYEDLIAAMPPHLPIITIRTDNITPLATIDLLYKANRFVAYLGEHFYHTNPNLPNNFCSIDKRVPKNGVDFKPDFKIYGALDIDTEKAVIGKLCKELKIEADNLQDLFKIRDSILEKEQWRTGKAEVNWKKAKPLSWDDFSFREVHEYDTEKQQCWSFNSKNDVRDGVKLQLGNMANGFGITILGKTFPNTEIPYQLAIFNNEKDSIKLQEDIIDPSKGWLGNGLKMKRTFIYGREYKRFLRDTEFENGKEMWCFEWMKWITWEKVRQNQEFKDILLSIPKDAVIIEQAQKRPTKGKPSMWGAWNEELKKERNIVIRTTQIENGLKKGSKATQVQDVLYAVNNVGTWIGENSEGQILTMAKLALNEGINLPIDADMLNEAKINWFGKVLQFTKHEDGLVTVEAVVPKIGKAPTNGIIGAIVGDIQGSVYELQEDKDKIKKDFSKKGKVLSTNKQLTYTDDTVLTIAIAKWLLEDKEHDKDTLIDLFRLYGDSYQRYKFSRKFRDWIKSGSRKPLGDVDDGSAMRVSPIGYYAKNIKECLELARISAEVTHNTEEGIRGAQAIAAAIFLNRYGLSKKEIKQYIGELFPTYNLKRKIEKIRPKYEQCFNCNNVIPETLMCFMEGKDYTETVNLAISFGGDTDTMACISGSISSANDEVPQEAAQYAYEILPNEFRNVLDEFTKQYHKQPKGKLPKPSDLMELVNVQPIVDEVDDTDDDEADLLIAESPTDGGDTNGGLETALLKPTRASRQKVKETPIEEKKTSQSDWKQANSSDGMVKGIIGAVIGDIIGSRFEFSKPPTRKVDRFTTTSTLTDDSVMTVAIADALLHGKDYMESMLEWGGKYPKAGYGNRFKQLLKGKKGLPTDSIANGSGMRVSPIGFHAKTLDEALERAKQSAIPSHNSVEGIKGAQSIAAAIFMAREQRPKEEIKSYIEKEFGYNLSQTDEEIKAHVSTLRHGDAKKGIPAEREFAENTCPLAIIAFLTTDDYESSIWKSISYGCDTDTVACMCGGIAAAYYGVPMEIFNEAVEYLPREILSVINEFDNINLQNRRITPKEYNRWGAVFVYGSGNDLLKDEKGHIIDEGGFDAKQNFGAKEKVKEGICNRSYAIPTMGKSLKEIKEGVDRFIEYAETHQEETFMVIEIGCKKAGYTPKDIAPMFAKIADLPNVYLPKKFREVLTENK